MFKKIASAALVAATLMGATAASTTSASAANPFWTGVAGGVVGGLILGAATQPSYGYGYAPSYGYAPRPVYYAPSCHREWRYDYYGNAYRVRVCN